MSTRAIITLPPAVRAGEVIEIRTLIAHPMETGHRADAQGQVVPRRIIRRFSCKLDGQPVFSADLHPAISANPFLSFTTVATASGEVLLRWIDDKGRVQEERATITVTG
jgi:sulfur-oxidizing protein SoxZ